MPHVHDVEQAGADDGDFAGVVRDPSRVVVAGGRDTDRETQCEHETEQQSGTFRDGHDLHPSCSQKGESSGTGSSSGFSGVQSGGSVSGSRGSFTQIQNGLVLGLSLNRNSMSRI